MSGGVSRGPGTRDAGAVGALSRGPSLVAVIGFLAFIEFTSGIIQGYYTPLLTDIARHYGVPDADVNWLEGSQLMLSALVVPLLAKLGDTVGKRRMLLVSTAITAVASLALPFAPTFGVFLAAWAVQGFYVIWLPLEIALVWSRAQDADSPARITRRAAGLLVAALEVGVIAGALSAGAIIEALPLETTLLAPGIAVAVCFVVVLLGVRDAHAPTSGRFDSLGAALLAVSLVTVTGGLSLLRLSGLASPWPWAALALGGILLAVFVRHALRVEEPVIDVRLFADPSLWPVFATAALFGVSVLGAQAPLSTFARTDPALTGYGLGATAGMTSILIGAYVLSLTAGSLLLPLATRFVRPRAALVCASLLVAAGYLLFVPFHATFAQTLSNMIIAGIGSGALVAALPAAAATAAPPDRTSVATGLTNSTKTLGGAVASAVFGLALLGAAVGGGGGAAEAGSGSGAGAGAGGAGAVGEAGAGAGADAATAAAEAAAAHAGSLSGYMTVWIVCGVTALAAAALLLIVPRHAFADARPASRDRSADAAPAVDAGT